VTPSHTQLTYRYERLRAVTSGVIETAGATFLLLVAVRGFNADATAKALIAASGSVGLLISPLVVSWVQSAGWPVAKGAARAAAVGAIALVVMALVPALPVYVIGSLISMACSSATIPLMTQVYQENYPDQERGSLFSRTMIIRIGVAALFSELGGRVLSAHIEYYRWLLIVFAGAFAFSSWCLARIPSRPLASAVGSHPFSAMRYAKTDRLFRLTLIAWMFMGMGNLMMYPMRVEYLANPRYGLTLEVSAIALLVGVIPNLARLVMSPIWGWLFDHMNFFALRMTLNLGFALGILSFFTSNDFTGLAIGAVIFGVSNAGGDVAWSMWVTKFAPPERVADYMAVHTFFTGLRGVIAPIIGFHLVTRVSIAALGWVSAGLIGISILCLLPEVRFGKTARKASALVEEVSE